MTPASTIPIYQGEEAKKQLQQVLLQSGQQDPAVTERVITIIEQVKTDGDKALTQLAQQFGDETLDNNTLPQDAIQTAVDRVPKETKALLQRAAHNIEQFGQAIVQQLGPSSIDHGEFIVGVDYNPVESVGCYVPAGRYPLPSTALMTTITAKTAGVKNIVLTSPKLKDEVVYAGTLAGVTRFHQIGGAQAIAALALGTDSVQPVDMIVGPGNAYVTEAKRQLQGTVGIDMLAGPSEVAIIADDNANPAWVALDLLAQAEHDPDARCYLFTTSANLANATADQIQQQVKVLNLPDFIHKALVASGLFVFDSVDDCIDASNQIAPEHLELLVDDPIPLKEKLTHYGALFLGHHTSVPYGDYLAGPNHTLPTGRAARFSGGLNPLMFLRPQGWVHCQPNPNQLAQNAHDFAQLEGLTAHSAAAIARKN